MPAGTLTFQKSRVSFASAAQTATLLTANDPYKQQLSPADRQLLAVSNKPVTVAETDEQLRAAAESFTAAEETQVKGALTIAGRRLSAMGITLKLPSTVTMAKHDGRIFAGALYTRANAVFMNAPFLATTRTRPDYLARILTHELSHIASRYHPESRAAVYRLVGFAPCKVPLTSLGADVRDRVITNPDTEDFGTFCISLPAAGSNAAASRRYTPLLLARDAVTGTNFREILTPVLVEVDGSGTAAVVKAGKTVTRELDAAYMKAIGGNGRDEPFHPEEIVAKNLETAMLGRPTAGSPDLALAKRVAAQLGRP